MFDTSEEMKLKQREILFAKTPSERFIIGADLIDFGRTILESSIKQKQPGISVLDLRIAVFKRCYEKEFEKEELERIIESMTNHFLHQC
ncbi:MAG: hypothetical protein K9H64_23555 [Bacteroidales bacterium]|nr:hypothetical protein [Bacteroidales bacterium]MCF8459021.1 hypothetical protein [Bacteroidales bacterium]